MAKPPKRFRLRVLLVLQILAGLVLSLFILAIGQREALSCLGGVLLLGFINVLLLGWLFFRGNQNPTQIIMRLYSGEIAKIILLIAGIIFLAHTFDIKWWAFILGIVVMQLSYCVIPYFMFKKGTVVL